MRARPVAVRFVAGNFVGWLAFTAAAFAGPFLLVFVPFVFGVGIAWAAGALKVGLASRIGFGAAAALGLVGVIFGLGPTLVMNGDELFLLEALYRAIPFMVVHGVAATVGLAPLVFQLGPRAHGFGVMGFVAGAALGGLAGTVGWHLADSGLLHSGLLSPLFGVPGWLPSIGGGLAVAWTSIAEGDAASSGRRS